MADLLPYQFGDSFADIIIDSATLLVGGEQLTISRGGWSFDPGEEWDDYQFPGRTMNTVGARQLVRLSPSIRGSAMMTGEDQLSAFRPDGTWAAHASIAGARTFTPNPLRSPLPDAAYLEDVVCLWKRQRGDYIAVEFPVAICRQWNIGSTDGDEGMLQLVIEASPDYTTGERPYRVRTVRTPTDVPGGGGDTPGDLPEDEDCGTVIDDRNAATLGLSDGASVTSWGDDTDIHPNAAPNAGIGQGAPTYRASGFSGGGPCVEFDGVNDGLTCASQIIASSFTMYLVLDAVGNPGGDGAGIIWFADGYPRSKGFTSLSAAYTGGSGGLGGFVNTHALFPTLDIAAYSGKSGPHVYAFVFDQGIGAWAIYVDGASSPLLESACPAAITLGTSSYIASSPGSNPVAMKMGRGVTYDKAHDLDCRNTVRAALQLLWPGLP